MDTKSELPLDVRKRLDRLSLQPLWESKFSHHAVRKIDNGHLWPWSDMRALMMDIAEVSSPTVIERRVVSMMDPHSRYPDGEGTSGSISATLQLLKPDEQARPHRHRMNALRFVLESTGGATTLVDGKRCAMEAGDLVLTPAWTWHAHHHQGERPVIWLDVLDVALHRFLGSEKFQPGPVTEAAFQLPDAYFAVANILPVVERSEHGYSPVFRYPWADAIRALEQAPEEVSGVRRVRYANPLTGGESLSTLDSTLLQIEGGAATPTIAVAADSLFCAAEGSGMIDVGGEVRRFADKDIFTAPAYRPFRVTADKGSLVRLFTVSNAPVFRKLGLYERQAD